MNYISERLDRYVPLAEAFTGRMVMFQSAIARKAGLSTTELICLRMMAQKRKGVTATELAGNTGLTLPAMTAVVDPLEQKGFLKRTRDSADRRRVTLTASRKAIGRIDALHAEYSAGVEAILDRDTDAEFSFLMRCFDEIGELLQGELSKPASERKQARGQASRARSDAGVAKTPPRAATT